MTVTGGSLVTILIKDYNNADHKIETLEWNSGFTSIDALLEGHVVANPTALEVIGNGLATLQAAVVKDAAVVVKLVEGTIEYVGKKALGLLSGVIAHAEAFVPPDSDSVVGVVQSISGFRDVIGTDGDDQIVGDNFGNILTGGAGSDLIQSGGGDDFIIAGAVDGADIYDGGDDIDTIVYTDAIQDIVVDLSKMSDQATGSGIGVDQITNVENVIAGSGADIISGSAAANSLSGEDGNDSLAGGAGNDLLNGGDGNDLLNGGHGADQMDGGAGNDLYVVDHRLDQVTEFADGGIDNVSARVSHVLSDNVENLFLIGSATVRSGGFFARKTTTIDLGIDGTGNGSDNLLRGNRGHNELDGLGGNDTLLGGAGADILQGGTGLDRLVGGAGADVFIFAAGDGGSNLAGADMLYDFEDGIDRVALAGGLSFTDLTISQGDGTDTADSNTVIRTSSGEYLVVLLHTSTSAITGLDFQLLGV
ncbi:MAG: hypothetical protein NDI91_11055 [Sulfuritalea sp.]|nr:hypothetical protein [Sulfuritalea sp.]